MIRPDLPPGYFYCDLCRAVRYGREQHNYLCHAIKVEVVPGSKHPCPFCSVGFTSKRKLTRHRAVEHPGERLGLSYAEAGSIGAETANRKMTTAEASAKGKRMSRARWGDHKPKRIRRRRLVPRKRRHRYSALTPPPLVRRPYVGEIIGPRIEVVAEWRQPLGRH